LEAQLISYNNLSKDDGKGDASYAFLNKKNIHDWDDLNSLFFQVLAKKQPERNEDVREAFAKVPYLNSSLFEPTALEQRTIMIHTLKNGKELPVISSTVLKNEQGKKLTGSLPTLEYLFRFLDAYDFASEGSEEIQEDNKTLINASVLGLIFEKINGYKDGSFFTPGFITMYMCRETIRRAVLQKFREAVDNLPFGSNPVKHLTPDPSPQRRGEGSQVRLGWRKIDPVLLQNARDLRKNATHAEDFLWQLIRNRQLLGYKFRRQHPVDQKFILDFFCAELMLGIELDGKYHQTIDQSEYDEGRTYELKELGITILRFTNEETIWETEKIFEAVRAHSETNSPSLPSPLGDSPGVREKKTRKLTSLSDIYDIIGPNELFSYAEANAIINSIKICDPAVGSGHFLVSALNEIIAVKNDLKILQDRSGWRLKEYQVEVVNDELIVTDEDGELFEYRPTNKESQRIQETLFHEKQIIIENCLFGVDINPNSVKIGRLRHWIALQKSAYYKALTPASPKGEELSSLSFGRGTEGEGILRELETLPNIDINIKCGNSLVSRFALNEDLSQALKKSKFSIDAYRIAVDRYRNAENKEEKREMEALIDKIKSDFRSEIAKNDPKIKRKANLGGELYNLTMQTGLFEESPKEKKIRLARIEKVSADLNKLETEIEDIKGNQIFENAFEWRFEFPEVLNDTGEFVGFDVVIGNPPYIRQEEFSPLKPYLKDRFRTFAGTADLYVYFVELSMNLLKESGNFVFIIPNKWMRAGYGKALRNYVKTFDIHELLDFGDLQVFEEATTYPLIIGLGKSTPTEKFTAVNLGTLDFPFGMEKYLSENRIEVLTEGLSDEGWTLTDSKAQKLLLKLKSQGVPLSEYVNGKIFYGIKTGYNEAFVIDQKTRDKLIAEDPKSAEVIKPFLAGRDIKRYQQPKSDKHLIFTRRGIDIENYPAVLSHLLNYKEQLEPKPKDFKGSNWRGRKPGSYKWYEIQDAVDYFGEFEKEKILWPGISSEITSFGFDQANFYGNDNNQMIISDDLYLLGFLNSKASKFILKNTCDFVRGGFARLKISYVSKVPIFSAKLDQKEKISGLVSLIVNNEGINTINIEDQIDQMVYEMYGLSEEEIGIVEGISRE
jgi:very-short-patch-repair endonuclease